MTMATTSSVSRNFPTLRYLAAPFRWFFRSRRRVLTVAVVLLAMIAVPPLWWSLQLVGLPDIGDPFDVEAFQKFTIPDDRNAFVPYLEAADRLRPLIASSKEHAEKIDLNAPWSRADPAVRRWVEENHEAMDLYRRGTERPDALDPALPSDIDSAKMDKALRSFHHLALLEASRLEERGEMADAWTWYRAALRTTYHMTLHAPFSMRLRAEGRNGKIRRSVSKWAVDPRTPPALLRRALDDVVACGSFTPSDSYTIKVGYPFDERAIEGSESPGRQLLIARLTAALTTQSFQPDTDHIRALADAWRFWRREPERSRRVMRLAIANRLAYLELPPDQRPDPDPGVSGPFALYSPGPESPPGARTLSPVALGRWLSTALDAREMVSIWDTSFRTLRLRERANHRALVVFLASELYRRDHKTDPPSDEALVGPYLKELPDDGRGDGPVASRPPAESPVQ
jgi:hypothetical protein